MSAARKVVENPRNRRVDLYDANQKHLGAQDIPETCKRYSMQASMDHRKMEKFAENHPTATMAVLSCDSVGGGRNAVVFAVGKSPGLGRIITRHINFVSVYTDVAQAFACTPMFTMDTK